MLSSTVVFIIDADQCLLNQYWNIIKKKYDSNDDNKTIGKIINY